MQSLSPIHIVTQSLQIAQDRQTPAGRRVFTMLGVVEESYLTLEWRQSQLCPFALHYLADMLETGCGTLTD